MEINTSQDYPKIRDESEQTGYIPEKSWIEEVMMLWHTQNAELRSGKQHIPGQYMTKHHLK